MKDVENKMNAVLKPCPFCGGEAELVNYGDNVYWVQ